MLAYETENFAGTLLVAGEETLAPEITYPLKARGWHRISIGLYGERFDGDTVIQVRLTRDPGFVVLTLKEGPDRAIQDLFWKEADLTGQRIVFSQLFSMRLQNGRMRPHRGKQAMLAYIKLEPLSKRALADLKADRANRRNKRLFAHNDSHGFVYSFGATTAAEIRREIEPYRDTDFSRLYWEAGMGDLLFYPGTVGRMLTCDNVRGFLRENERVHAEASRVMRRHGLDTLRLACEMTHEIGLEFHAGYRMGGFRWPPPMDHWNGPGFFESHPELRAVTRDGRLADRMSYAFPETRRFVISLLRDVTRRPVDGICLIYVRRPPFVDYEPPLVEGFQARYGKDPRKLPPDDPRWLRYRCGVLTQFMREVRQAMDEVARVQKRKARIGVTAIVSGRQDENIRNGMNVADWIAEGLVDTLIPYTMAPALDSGAEAWPDPLAASRWVKLTKGTSCALSLSMLPRFLSPEDFRRRADALYKAGGESLFFWDCSYRVNYHDQSAWNSIRRLGHVREIAEWKRKGQRRMKPPATRLSRLGGWDLSDDTPG